MLIQLYIPTDCTRQIRSFVKHNLLLHTKVIIYVNRNYVNLAVKFRYPNYMELRPLKYCIGQKLTSGLKNFEHGNACFVHLVTKVFPLGEKKNMSQYIFFLKVRDETKQTIFME